MVEDFEACYRAVRSRDARFDGRFFTAVTSTGIYCRPSCPARTPLPRNVRFFRHAAAAERAGFRACRRCRPEIAPDAPGWDAGADLVSRGLRLIAEGRLDAEGVPGLARRLAVSERHLHRLFVRRLGAAPLRVAQTRRVALARRLIDETALPMSEVAVAAGYSSLRRFNAAVHAAYGATPSELRARSRRVPAPGGPLELRLPLRAPFAGRELAAFLGARAIPGVEEVVDRCYRRVVSTGAAPSVLELDLAPAPAHVLLRLSVPEPTALVGVVAAARRLLDLDADPAAVDEVLARDPLLEPFVVARPGLRLAGSYDPWETAVRAVLGQQVTVAAARTLAGRLVARLGAPLVEPSGALTHAFPPPERIAAASVEEIGALGMPARRASTLRTLAAAVAAGDVALDGADPDRAAAALGALPGIGPWTVSYLRLRALGDPDALPETDLGLRRGLERAGVPGDPAAARARAERWRPFRGYGLVHVWTAASDAAGRGAAR